MTQGRSRLWTLHNQLDLVKVVSEFTRVIAQIPFQVYGR